MCSPMQSWLAVMRSDLLTYPPSSLSLPSSPLITSSFTSFHSLSLPLFLWLSKGDQNKGSYQFLDGLRATRVGEWLLNFRQYSLRWPHPHCRHACPWNQYHQKSMKKEETKRKKGDKKAIWFYKDMKYLGRIATLTTLSPVIQAVCTCEMVTRATKYILLLPSSPPLFPLSRSSFVALFSSLRLLLPWLDIDILTAHLRHSENYHLSHSIAHFLNCLLGSVAKGGITAIQVLIFCLFVFLSSLLLFSFVSNLLSHLQAPPSLRQTTKATKKKKSTSRSSSSSPFALSHATLWESIIASVKEKYLYELPKTFGMSPLQLNNNNRKGEKREGRRGRT